MGDMVALGLIRVLVTALFVLVVISIPLWAVQTVADALNAAR